MLISKIPFLFSSLKPGDVIAFQQPGYGLLVKRIQEVYPDGTFNVLGSHPGSVDSRVFGSVKHQDLLGKVIWHVRKT